MDDTSNRAIQNIQERISSGLGISESLRLMRADIADSPFPARAPITSGDLLGQIYDVEQDYRRISGFMSQGYDDGGRDALCRHLMSECYRLAGNLYLCRLSESNASIVRATAMARVAAETPESTREQLERFTQDIALIELEDVSRRAEKRHLIYANHARMADSLFCRIVASTAWSDNMAHRYGDIILSSTVDSSDSLLMVSAITLSLLTVFDVQKWLLLIRVWREAASDALAQRAFVGWVLSVPARSMTISDAPPAHVRDTLRDILDTTDARGQLLELQMQIFQCLNADADGRKLQEEIMPTLVKNSGITVKNGEIIERDDDPMDDILPNSNLEATEKKVEESFRQLIDMHSSGADIYFHGFRQMKRFPFFSTLSNWFLPFYPEHPDLESKNQATANMIRLVASQHQFCESDKYSIAFAFRQVGARLPQNLKDHLANGVATDITPSPTTPTIERRRYLQDLFRFFSVCPNGHDFENPFADHSRMFFFASSVFQPEMLAAEAETLASFIYKRRLWAYVIQLQSALGTYATPTVSQLAAGAMQRSGDNQHAYELSRQQLEYSSAPFILGVHAAAARAIGHWKEASKAYNSLLSCYPGDKKWIEMALAICLLHQNRIAEALPHLQHLYYEQPDNIKVAAAIIAAYLADGNTDEAMKVGKAVSWPDKFDSLDADKQAAYRKVALRHYYAMILQHHIAEANLHISNAFRKLFGSNEALLRETARRDSLLQTRLSISRYTIELSISVAIGEC